MGQTPAKMFSPPVPYGQSPNNNVLMQAQAASPAPQQSFLPLNGQPAQQPMQAQTQPAQVPTLGGSGISPIYRGFGPAQRVGGLFS